MHAACATLPLSDCTLSLFPSPGHTPAWSHFRSRRRSLKSSGRSSGSSPASPRPSRIRIRIRISGAAATRPTDPDPATPSDPDPETLSVPRRATKRDQQRAAADRNGGIRSRKVCLRAKGCLWRGFRSFERRGQREEEEEEEGKTMRWKERTA